MLEAYVEIMLTTENIESTEDINKNLPVGSQETLC